MTSTSDDTPQASHRVRVWFGRHTLCDHTAGPAEAAAYAQAMRRRFAGLRITIDTDPDPGTDAPPLPAERLWELTVK